MNCREPENEMYFKFSMSRYLIYHHLKEDSKPFRELTWNLIPHTDRNIFEDSYYLVKYFPDFQLWESTIASFKQNYQSRISGKCFTN